MTTPPLVDSTENRVIITPRRHIRTNAYMRKNAFVRNCRARDSRALFRFTSSLNRHRPPMKSALRLLAATALTLSFTTLAHALSPDDVLKAQKIIQVVLELTAKYPTASGNVAAPTPLTDKSGAFCVPYKADGQLTEWANKALNAQIGAALGAKAGEKVGDAAISRVPVPGAGLLSGAFKKKGKEIGAVAAVGGTDFIKKSSDYSFANLDDLAVYLHVKHGTGSDYAQALATAMAIYPNLEKGYDVAVKAAYERAAKAAPATASK